jgi:hypothetical protein
MRRAPEPGRNRGARGGMRSAAPCERLACPPPVAVDEPGVLDAVRDGRAARARVREVAARHHVLGVAERRRSKYRGAPEPLDAVCGPSPVDRPQELLPRRRCGCDRNAARRKHRGECDPAQHDAEHELPATTHGSMAQHEHHPQSSKTPTPRRRREGQHHADPPHRRPAANLEPDGGRTRLKPHAIQFRGLGHPPKEGCPRPPPAPIRAAAPGGASWPMWPGIHAATGGLR